MSTGHTTISQDLQDALTDFPEVAQRLLDAAGRAKSDAPEAVWPAVAAALDPAWPIEVHRAAHRGVFARWDADRLGPPPTWFPDARALAGSNAGALCADRGLAGWSELHRWSINDRDLFWSTMIERLGVVFDRPPQAIRGEGDTPEVTDWLPGARLNIAASCFLGPADRPAIRQGRADGSIQTWTLGELDRCSARVASGLRAMGLPPGEPIAIDMPMTADAVAIYLGIVRGGFCVVSIADSFAPAEIATRLRIANCGLVFTQDVIPRGDKALPLYAKVVEAGAKRCVVVSAGDALVVNLRPGDTAFNEMLGEPDTSFVPCDPADTTNILFSSGTTGDPKAIPWTHTTPMRCAVDGHLHLDIRAGDTVAWPTNLGWMMGPWLIFASLMNQAAIAMFDGPPAGPAFARFIQDAKVSMLGVVPSMVKNWRATNCLDGVDWSGIRCFGSTGECSNADDYFWLSSRARYRPVIEYCGGTEIGGGYITGSPLQPQSPALFTTPSVGLDFVLLDEDRQPADSGEVYLIGPSIGLSQRLLNRDHHETYFANCPHSADGQILRRHGDQIRRLPGNVYRAEGRADDTMNLGGIKVSSAEIERAVLTLPGLREAAAIATTPSGGGPSELIVFYVPDPMHPAEPDDIAAAMRQRIRDQINPLFRLHRAIPIDSIPRTASNKIMRRKLRDKV